MSLIKRTLQPFLRRQVNKSFLEGRISPFIEERLRGTKRQAHTKPLPDRGGKRGNAAICAEIPSRQLEQIDCLGCAV